LRRAARAFAGHFDSGDLPMTQLPNPFIPEVVQPELVNPFMPASTAPIDDNRFVLDEAAFMAAITELADPRRERFNALARVASAMRAEYEETKIQHNLDPARYPFAVLEKLRVTLEEAEAGLTDLAPAFLADPRPEYLAATRDERTDMRMQFAIARQFQPIFDLLRAA
jgi:hypothetical protein